MSTLPNILQLSTKASNQIFYFLSLLKTHFQHLALICSSVGLSASLIRECPNRAGRGEASVCARETVTRVFSEKWCGLVRVFIVVNHTWPAATACGGTSRMVFLACSVSIRARRCLSEFCARWDGARLTCRSGPYEL